MNAKMKLKNDILIGMRNNLDTVTLAILETVVVDALKGIEMVEIETLPATVDNTNKYIMELFMTRKAIKLSEETVKAYLGTINEFVAFINKPLNKVTECDIECYLYQKRKMDNSNTSLNNARRNLSAFFTWMRKVKLIADNPCDGVETFQEIKKPVDYLEVTDYEQIKTGCKYKRDRAMLEFLRSTAMRKGEVPLVKISDINFNTGRICIFGHKANRFRTVFLDKVALHYIKEYLLERGVSQDSDEPLFTHLKGDKTIGLDGDGIYYAIRQIGKRAGIERRVYPHVFRKTVATNMVKRGASEDAAGEYLGHAPKSVTGRHYINKTDQYVENLFHNYVEAV